LRQKIPKTWIWIGLPKVSRVYSLIVHILKPLNQILQLQELNLCL
jgi:hypothetical protein